MKKEKHWDTKLGTTRGHGEKTENRDLLKKIEKERHIAIK
jgi:hypothetical protein